MRSASIVRTLETGREVTSIEVSPDGRHITTADGKEVRGRQCPACSAAWRNAVLLSNVPLV